MLASDQPWIENILARLYPINELIRRFQFKMFNMKIMYTILVILGAVASVEAKKHLKHAISSEIAEKQEPSSTGAIEAAVPIAECWVSSPVYVAGKCSRSGSDVDISGCKFPPSLSTLCNKHEISNKATVNWIYVVLIQQMPCV